MLETIFYIVLTAYTASGENFHSNLSLPFDGSRSCSYYMKTNLNQHPLPFTKNELGEYIITYQGTEHVIEFWQHQCEEFYYDIEDGKWKQGPNSI